MAEWRGKQMESRKNPITMICFYRRDVPLRFEFGKKLRETLKKYGFSLADQELYTIPTRKRGGQYYFDLADFRKAQE
jgi:hypothetical protein